MPTYTAEGVDTLVNTNTADGQISPRVVRLADGKYMVVWVGGVIQPTVSTNGTIAPAFTNADIRAQIYNADGTPSGGEIIINTTTAAGQLRPVVAQLSDGNVLISWHDGVGPAGGSAESVSNTIRAQEFNSAGVATGAEFALGNSNGRLHSLAATATGGFVVTYQEGGVGGALAVGNFVARVFDSNNVQTSTFVFDNTQPIGGHNGTYTAVEADGDIVIYWTDRDPVSNFVFTQGARFDANGTLLGNQAPPAGTNFGGAIALASGGHAYIASYSTGSGQPVTIFARMFSMDGSIDQYVEIAQIPTLFGLPTITATANGGFIATWGIDSDPTAGFNIENMARAFNAIGNPIGPAFQVNSSSPGNQSPPAMVQLTNGDIIAVWSDDGHFTGDAVGTGINMRRIDFDPTNHNPAAADFGFSLYTVTLGQTVTEDPAYITGFLGPDGYDADGDPLVMSGISNVANGTVTLNPDGTLTMITTPGAPGRLAFDYSISDGQGGTATARATVTLPSDFVKVRAGDTAIIDFLANDYYAPSPGASGFIVTYPGPVDGGTVEGFAALISTGNGPRIYYDPLGIYSGSIGTVDLNSSFFSLLVGQTAQYRFFYYNNQTASIDVTATVQGWAQLGGTGADNLIGTALADHLSGGTGAANVLQGGAGNDWYTIAVAGDTIIELPGEGIDSVRTSLSTFALPDNVENLRFNNVTGMSISGTGNALDNLITAWGLDSTLYGLGGNDTLIGGPGSDLLVGGTGADFLDGGPGFDSASYAASPGGVTINLATNVNTGGDAQGDTLISIEAIVGSAFADNITGSLVSETFTGGGGADYLSGGAGYDRFFIGTGSEGSSIDGGADSDTLTVSGTVSSLAALAGIEVIELQFGASLTLTGSQFNTGLAAGSTFASTGAGNGTITVNMETGIGFSSRGYVAAGGAVTFVVNGTSGTDIIKAGNFVGTLNGGGGSDQITGGANVDTINGGDGNDKIMGFGGADILTGGAGSDTFRFGAATDSGIGAAADQITDFVSGTDKLGFTLIDTDPIAVGDQGFTFIANTAFHATGVAEIRYTDSGANLLVQADIDGDGIADMEVLLAGLAGQTLTVGDFLL
jgi:hypothetical protein